jgi:predicted  nucleic acid-binding Zn-ribbon protein
MSLSDDHKAALAKGRSEARTVRAYLDALATKKPRGTANPTTLKQRLERLTEQIETEQNSLKRLQLIQQRFDVEDKLKAVGDSVDYEALEADFVAAAASYSERKGISYSAWREAGVAPDVLKTAGIRRTRRT